MKKIFTLAAAVLASLSLWAAVPATTLDPTDVPTEGWAGKYAPAAIVNGDWVCFSPYEIYQSNSQTWAAKDAGGSTDGSWDATDPFPAQSAWTTNDGKVATVRQDTKGPYYYRITNTTDVAALVKSGSNKKRTVFLEAYELTNGEAPATPTKSISMESSTMAVIALNELDATKEYMIVVRAEDTGTGGSSSGNSNYYAIGFKAVTKEVDHVDVTLGGVALNGEALGELDMATLYGALTLNLDAEYVEAPTVTFTVQKDTYYVGEETPSTKSENIDVVAALNPNGKWQAQQTVGEQTYTITAVKPATATITYMDGATVLGEEIVKVGDPSTKHGEYEVKPLAEFQGWYTDAELTSEADLTAAVNADKTLYGKFVKAYAQSLNIEQLVVTNGKSYSIKDALTAAGYEYSNLDALDSLNNDKGAARNEPYLGLKIKTQGGFIACNVATGSTIRVKFGYVENDVLAIAGNDTMTLTPANKTLDVLEFTAEADTYVKIQTTSGKTVVIKQIMVNEAITDVMYKITYAAAEHGTVSGWTIAYPNEEVTVAIAPEAGYLTYSLTYNGVALHDDENTGAATFTMPAEAVTVAAEFLQEFPTAIDNSEAEVKVVKRVVNGQLVIEKNGVLFNAQGAIVK